MTLDEMQEYERRVSSLEGEIKALKIAVFNLEQRAPKRPASLDGLPDEAVSFSGERGARDHVQIGIDDVPLFGLNRGGQVSRFMVQPSRWARFWCWLLRLPKPQPRPLLTTTIKDVGGLAAWASKETP